MRVLFFSCVCVCVYGRGDVVNYSEKNVSQVFKNSKIMFRVLKTFCVHPRTQSFASEEHQIRRELAIAHRLVAHYDMDELTRTIFRESR